MLPKILTRVRRAVTPRIAAASQLTSIDAHSMSAMASTSVLWFVDSSRSSPSASLTKAHGVPFFGHDASARLRDDPAGSSADGGLSTAPPGRTSVGTT